MKHCQQKPSCDQPAVGEMFWPGKEPTLVCEKHEEAAKRIAAAMGFCLHVAVYVDPGVP